MPDFPPTLTAPGWGEIALDPALVLVLLREPVDLSTVDGLLGPLGLRLANAAEPGWAVHHGPAHLWLAPLDGVAGLLADLAGQALPTVLPVAHVVPVYDTGRTPEARIAPRPDVLLVGNAAGLGDVSDLGLRVDDERSRYLGGYDWVVVGDQAPAWEARAALLDRFPDADVLLDFALMQHSPCGVPNDPLFGDQWNMTQIHAPEAWEVGHGSPSVVVAIIESQAVAAHPDLVLAAPPVDPTATLPPTEGDHATSCAGIAAATMGNGIGVAGVAGGCRILSVCSSNLFSDAGLAAAVRYAVAHGANVISMSFATLIGPDTSQRSPLFEAAMRDAAAQGVVLCAGSGNNDWSEICFPALSPAVMAVGGSDRQDRRVQNKQDPDWNGSNYGPELSVVAPAVESMTTTFPVPGYARFHGTSCATPHVAGLAALLRSTYPSLTGPQVRSIIERTAFKPPNAVFADDPRYPNGTRNAELGYGRIDAFRAVDFADVMIRDDPSDTGVEPSAPPNGVFWERSDIIVAPALLPLLLTFNTDPAAASRIVRGADNRIYVRVRNNGPAVARDVVVSVRVAAFAGTGFAYPGDWTAVDADHVEPVGETTTFARLAVGQEAVATFLLPAADVARLDAWTAGSMHPCVLAVVTAGNDYAFASVGATGDPVAVRRNNVAQRNVTVADLLSLRSARFPFLAGSGFGPGGLTELEVDRSLLPVSHELHLEIPALDDLVVHRVAGGELTEHASGRTLQVIDRAARVAMDLDRGRLVPLAARVTVPDAVAPEPFVLRMLQRDEAGAVVGGVTVIGTADGG
jgi:hypothetical protein